MAPKNPIRRHARRPFIALVQVSWKEAGGRLRSLPARCVELSLEGAKLETDVPIPRRTSISLHSARYGSLGMASVRHCVRRSLKYHLGIEFTSSLSLAGDGRKRCMEEIQASQEQA